MKWKMSATCCRGSGVKERKEKSGKRREKCIDTIEKDKGFRYICSHTAILNYAPAMCMSGIPRRLSSLVTQFTNFTRTYTFSFYRARQFPITLQTFPIRRTTNRYLLPCVISSKTICNYSNSRFACPFQKSIVTLDFGTINDANLDPSSIGHFEC